LSTIFNRGALEIRDASHADILPIAHNMRDGDVQEVWASHCKTPAEALTIGMKNSAVCYTAVQAGVPCAMFGVVPMPDGDGQIWFLGTDLTYEIKICFGRVSRIIVDRFLKIYPALYNYVDVRNKKSIEWLKWLGASFLEPKPYGDLGLPFQFFMLTKGQANV
jgi:hypothetical protein